MTKIFIPLICGVLFYTGNTGAAEKFMDGWTPTRRELATTRPECISLNESRAIFKGLPEFPALVFFNPNPLKASLGNTVDITLTASGKGLLKVGFYAYSREWDNIGILEKPIQITNVAQELKLSLPVKEIRQFKKDKTTTIIRPYLLLFPGSEITVTAYDIKIGGKGIPVAEWKAESVPNRPELVYRTGENAVFTVSVKCDGKPVREGTADISFFKNGTPAGSKKFDLEKANPFRVSETMNEPGFLLARILLKDKNNVVTEDAQMGGAAFDPMSIRAGRKTPGDLLSYWRGQYEKLNREVPPGFKVKKYDEDKNFIRYKIICDNFEGTKTYAGLVIPKGKGPFPMVLSVPPAGNSGFGFFSTPGAIHLTITVFDRLFPSQENYLNFSRPEWYFYKGAQKRETYYYYKSILGVMRMMDYAMTQIKEWDGKHLIAVGRSQGGGFAFIMAGLNPKIQALSADVPALCDHNARQAGRRPGWPQLLDFHTTAKSFAEDAPYYDAANFALLVNCPAVVSAGFLDTMCEPASVYAAFNNLKGEKKIYNCPQYGHGWGKRSHEFENASNQLIGEYLKK